MAVIHKKGKERLAELHEQHRAESGRLLLKTLADAGGVERLSAAHEVVAAHHGNNYLPLLERFYKSHRSALFTLLDTLELEVTSVDHSVLDAVEFLRAIRGRTGEYVPEKVTVGHGADAVPVAIDVDFVTESWRKILVVKDRLGMLVRRHQEVCVFSYLASELRSGDIAVVGADSYANLHAQLMTWDECAPLAAQFCGQAGIPSDPKQLTAHCRAALGEIAAAVDVADLGPDALANRRVLAIAMSMAGLVNYPTLWWRWSYGDRYWATRTGATACYDVVDPPRPAIESNMD